MQQFDVLVLTALMTLVALGIISAFLVVGYRRTHAAEIRQDLMSKAEKLGLIVDPEISNHDLRDLIKQARREAQARGPKTA